MTAKTPTQKLMDSMSDAVDKLFGKGRHASLDAGSPRACEIEMPGRPPDSLVARLRMVPHVTLCTEAADEIDRLSARLARIEQAADAMRKWIEPHRRLSTPVDALCIRYDAIRKD